MKRSKFDLTLAKYYCIITHINCNNLLNLKEKSMKDRSIDLLLIGDIL